MNAPDAEVVSIRGQQVTVLCPYCGQQHTHSVRTAELGQTEHRSPGCGLYRSTADRLAGYVFTTPPKKGTTHA